MTWHALSTPPRHAGLHILRIETDQPKPYYLAGEVCPRCAYALPGLVAGECPECSGRVVHLRRLGRTRTLTADERARAASVRRVPLSQRCRWGHPSHQVPLILCAWVMSVVAVVFVLAESNLPAVIVGSLLACLALTGIPAGTWLWKNSPHRRARQQAQEDLASGLAQEIESTVVCASCIKARGLDAFIMIRTESEGVARIRIADLRSLTGAPIVRRHMTTVVTESRRTVAMRFEGDEVEVQPATGPISRHNVWATIDWTVDQATAT